MVWGLLLRAAKAAWAAAKKPAVRQKAIEAAQKAKKVFGKTWIKTKQICKEGIVKSKDLLWKIRERKKLDDILRDATVGKKSSSIQYGKKGGFNRANKDFDSLVPPSARQVRPDGIRTGQMSNGSKVTVRPNSTNGKPTLEVQPPTGKTIKVRYD